MMHFLRYTGFTVCLDLLRSSINMRRTVYIVALMSFSLQVTWSQNPGGFMGVQSPWFNQMQAQMSNMFHPGGIGLVHPPINNLIPGLQHHIQPPIRPDLRSNSPPPSMQSGQDTGSPNANTPQINLGSLLSNSPISPNAPSLPDSGNSRNQPSQSGITGRRTPTPDCPGGCDINYVCYGGGCQLQGDSLCSPVCQDNYACDHGRCIFAPCNPSCRHGNVCRNKKCVPIPCHPGCTEGQFCDAGKCVLDDSKHGCNPPCPLGYRCHPSPFGVPHCDKPTHHSRDSHVMGGHATGGRVGTGLPIQPPNRPEPPRPRGCPGGCPVGIECVEGVCERPTGATSVVIGAVRPGSVRTVTESPTQGNHELSHDQPVTGDNSCRPACASVDVCMTGDCLTVDEARERQRRERERNQRPRAPQPAPPRQNQRSASGTILCGEILCTIEEYCFNGACIGIHTGDVRRMK